MLRYEVSFMRARASRGGVMSVVIGRDLMCL